MADLTQKNTDGVEVEIQMGEHIPQPEKEKQIYQSFKDKLLGNKTNDVTTDYLEEDGLYQKMKATLGKKRKRDVP